MAKEYGLYGVGLSIPPSATPEPGGAEREIYTFNPNCKKVTVMNHPDSGINMHVLFNDDGTTVASALVWDVVLAPGDQVSSPDELMINTVGVHFTGVATWGTDFSIRGWT